MIAKLTQRDKIILGAIGAVAAVVATVFLFKFFLTNKADLQKQLGAARAKVEVLRKREADRSLWAQRDAWLTANLPVLGDPDVANKALRESILEIAKQHTVTLDAPAPGIPAPQPSHISIAVRIEAKGTWEGMGNFLFDLQGPDKFVVIESCDLKVNREDKTQLRSALSVARWFAPK